MLSTVFAESTLSAVSSLSFNDIEVVEHQTNSDTSYVPVRRGQ
jgi:hypothetical protein